VGRTASGHTRWVARHSRAVAAPERHGHDELAGALACRLVLLPRADVRVQPVRLR
jgi:hypothetical protein